MTPSAPGSAPGLVVGDAPWLRAARWARTLSWISLVWMVIEGAAGIAALGPQPGGLMRVVAAVLTPTPVVPRLAG